MPAPDNGAIARRMLEEVWNQGNLDVLDELLARDFVSHDPILPSGRTEGIEGYKSIVTVLREAFPDLQITLERQIDISDQVICLVTFRGTNKGTFAGAPPSGRKVSVSWINILRMSDGKVAEEWISTGDAEPVVFLGGR